MRGNESRVFLIGALLLFGVWIPAASDAQVSVDIHIGPPPPYSIPASPPVVVIPGTYVYMIPDITAEIFFYGGFWYRPYEGHWFRAHSYNGPWLNLPPERVPPPLLRLPPDYRRVPPGYRRIPYGQMKKNWAGWERQQYWARDRQWREGWHGKPEERGMGHGEERHGGGEGRGGEEHGGGHHQHEGQGHH